MNAKPKSDGTHRRLEALGKLVDGSPAVLFLWRIEPGHWSVEVVSANVQELLGYSAKDFTSGRVSWPGITHPEDVPRLERDVSDLLAAGRNEWSQQYRLIAKSGETIWVEDWSRVVRGTGGQATHIQALVMDVTDRRRAEEAIRRAKHDWEKTFDAVPDAIMLMNSEHGVIRVNWAMARLLGMHPRDCVGRKCYELVHGTAESPSYCPHTLLLNDGQEHTVELHEDRLGKDLLVSISPFRDGEGRLVGAVHVARDVTERKREEEAVRQTEERYRTLFESSRDAIMTLFPPDWKFTSANASTVKMFGAKDEKDFVSMAPWEVSPERQPDGLLSVEKARRMIETAMETGSHFFEWTHRRIGGESFPATVLLTRVEFGGHKGLQATVRDITEQKRAKEEIRAFNASLEQRVAERTAELRQSEAKLALAASGTRIGIFDRNLLTGETMATEQHVQLLGLRPTTTTTTTTLSQRYHYRDWADRVHPEDLRRVEAEMDQCGTKRAPLETEYRIVWPNNNLHWVAVRGVFEYDEQGAPIRLLGIMLDVTARKRVEEELHRLTENLDRRVKERTADLAESEARFRTIFDTAAAGLFVRDMDTGRLVLANKACLDMMGYTLEEFAALRLEDLHLPEDLPFIRGEIVKFSNGEIAPPADVRFKRKDGSLILVEVHPNAVWFNGQVHALMALRDVTERRRMEKELTQSHESLRALLARMELAREEERTRVARDIHDDLGQNLTALKMDLRAIERALEKTATPQDLAAVKTRAADAIEMADAASATVQELAAELRPGVLDKLGLGPAIRFEVRRFQTHFGIKCMASVPDALPAPAPVVATALFRILQECLTNVARHSGATRVSVRLGVRGNDLLLRVHDNGSGITDEALDRPLSLGLLGMKERAAVLDGQVTIRRNSNGGTVVMVRIPNHEL